MAMRQKCKSTEGESPAWLWKPDNILRNPDSAVFSMELQPQDRKGPLVLHTVAVQSDFMPYWRCSVSVLNKLVVAIEP